MSSVSIKIISIDSIEIISGSFFSSNLTRASASFLLGFLRKILSQGKPIN
ncbi:hypothetical protein LEP1GSC105_2938 [Leptospira interrogans str. UI 12758]|uniref:Uncharacterized protein n=1 Tax=Leptospira interrogans str. UI 12758 TaxID=1049938 RepID=A0A0E2D4J3_LEPIR|nr:hypothetical protein LEP1GSC105_2938 [Leptospira interrogans str. UI 12758]